MFFYKCYMFFALLVSCFFANGQKQFQGTYAGTLMGGRVACMLKVSSGIVIGSMYDGPENYHSITATIEEDKFNGTIYHKIFGEGVLEGYFKQDSLILTVNLFNNISPFLLKKQTDNLKLNIDKIFGKPQLDKNLFDDWIKIDMTDLNGNKLTPKIDSKNISFTKSGDYYFQSEPLKDGIEFKWNVVANELYIHVSSSAGFSYDYNRGSYQIKNDTLIITDRVKFKTIETYLRKK